MRRALLLAVLASCGVELDVPSEVSVACVRDADCPDGRVCARLIGQCVTVVDSDAPRILGVDVPASDRLRVVFSEPMACGPASTTGTYAIEPPLLVSAAAGVDCESSAAFTTEAVLFTSEQQPATPYMLRATAITDQGGNPLSPDGASFTFAGFGELPDSTPPDALAPPDRARVLGARQPLTWTTRAGATTYVVEVATDPDFTTPIAGSPFTVQAPQTTLGLESLSDVTYYWRVHSDLSAAGDPPATHDFDVLVDTVYVGCAGTGPCDTTIVRNGSKTRPYASVQRALAAAAELSTSLDVAVPTVKIAARPNGAVYPGAVVIQWQSVRVLGGFDATFTVASTDPAATVLENDGGVMYVINLPLTVSTVIEGLTLRATRAGTPVVAVEAASSSLTLRRLVIEGPGSDVALVAVQGGPSSGPLFDGCSITCQASPTDNATLVSVRGAAPTFLDTVFTVAPDAYDVFTAVDIAGPLPGDATFERFALHTPPAAGSTRGFVIDSATPGGRVVLREALVQTGAGSDGSVVFMKNAASLHVERSHLAAGFSSIADAQTHVITSDAFEVTNELAIVVRNSILEGPACLSGGCKGAVLHAFNTARVEINSSSLLARGVGAIPLVVSQANPVIVNSVLAGFDSGVPCIDHHPSPSWVTFGLPEAMLNTALVRCAGFRGYDYDSVEVTADTTAELDALNGATIRSHVCPTDCQQARIQAVIPLSAAPTAVFTDLDGADDDASTLDDNDYRLLSGADVFIRQGGLDGNASICAPLGATLACNVPATDFYGAPRNVPYSIGHAEVP